MIFNKTKKNFASQVTPDTKFVALDRPEELADLRNTVWFYHNLTTNHIHCNNIRKENVSSLRCISCTLPWVPMDGRCISCRIKQSRWFFVKKEIDTITFGYINIYVVISKPMTIIISGLRGGLASCFFYLMCLLSFNLLCNKVWGTRGQVSTSTTTASSTLTSLTPVVYSQCYRFC